MSTSNTEPPKPIITVTEDKVTFDWLEVERLAAMPLSNVNPEMQQNISICKIAVAARKLGQ